MSLPPSPGAGRRLLGSNDEETREALRLRPLGIDVTVLGANPAIAKAARSVLGGIDPSGTERQDLAFLLTVSVPAVRSLGTGLGAFAAAPDGHAYRESDGLYTVLSPCGSVTVADLAGGRAVLFAGDGVDLARSAEALLGSPLWRFAAHQGLVAAHAACVAVDGQALVLRGAAGSGKSTLAAACLLAGERLLSEEVTWLDARRARPCLLGLPGRVHLDEAARRLLRIAATPDASVGSGGATSAKRRLDLSADPLLLGRLVARLPLGPVVFLDPASASGARPPASRWSTLGADEAAALWRAGLSLGETSQAPERLEAMARTLLSHGAYRLAAGDPDSSVEALRSIAAHHREGRRP